ncbi:MAG: hypothetical protein U0736_17190 [Gemmataceae bacterium]
MPTLVPLDGRPSPQVRVDVPRYTDLITPQILSPGVGNGGGDRRQRGHRPRRRRPAAAAGVGRVPAGHAGRRPGGAASPRSACLPPAGRGSRRPTSAARWPARCRRFSASIGGSCEATFRPAVNGNYVLTFEDEHELVNSRLYGAAARPAADGAVRATGVA